jgi:1,4-dihydroxy-2-naphthoate octaprenyltransferase
MSKLKVIISSIRVPFLLLSPVCVFLGLGLAIWKIGHVNPVYVALAFLVGLLAHISVNSLNEYVDFKTGLDAITTKTPFNGGSGILQKYPQYAWIPLQIGIICAVLAGIIGIALAIAIGPFLLLITAPGLLLILTYTPWLNRSPILCLIAPGTGFGICMVLGTEFVLTKTITWNGFLVSLIPFFLVNNLLLLNQFPGAEADQTVGRKNLPITIGKHRSAVVYVSFLAATYAVILFGVIFKFFPFACLLGLFTGALAIPTCSRVLQFADDSPKLLSAQGLNVLIVLITPVLVGIGFLLGKL